MFAEASVVLTGREKRRSEAFALSSGAKCSASVVKRAPWRWGGGASSDNMVLTVCCCRRSLCNKSRTRFRRAAGGGGGGGSFSALSRSNRPSHPEMEEWKSRKGKTGV